MELEVRFTVDPAGVAALQEALQAASERLTRHALLYGCLPPRRSALPARPVESYTPYTPAADTPGLSLSEYFSIATGTSTIRDRFALVRALGATPSRRNRRLARRARKRKLRNRR